MKRNALWLAVAGVVSLTACQSELDVGAEVEEIDPETGEATTQPLDNLRVQVLPFDRDWVFDSLAAEHPEPEPELDEAVEEAREEMREYRDLWRQAESEWSELRSQLEEISQEMEQYAPGESAYQELFAQFEALEDEYDAAEARKDEYFEEFTALQDDIFDELQEYRLALEAWENEAFADYPQAVAELEDQRGREIAVDTTDATGRARFILPAGEWWVHGRHRLPQVELYWNVPVELEQRETAEVILDSENAEERTIY